MRTTARPRTLVLVFGEDGVEVAMLGPTCTELGVRQVVAAPSEETLWPAIEQLGELDRITVAGVDATGVSDEIARQSQRPLRHMSIADLRWSRVIAHRGVELALSLHPRFTSALFHDGREVPGLDIGAHRFRKDKTYREYLAPRVLEKKGERAWSRRLGRALDEILAVWNPSTLFLALPPEAPPPEVAANVTVVPPPTALDAAVTVWRHG